MMDPEPCFCICGISTFMLTKTPRWFTASNRSYCSTLTSARLMPPSSTPALLWAMSSRPNAATVVATKFSKEATSVTSVLTATTSFPPPEFSAASLAASALMSATATRAPFSMSTLTVSRPMPPPPPVTIATLPSNVAMMNQLLSVEKGVGGVGAQPGRTALSHSGVDRCEVEIDAVVVDQAVGRGGPHADDGDGDRLTVEPVVSHPQLHDRVVALVPLVPDGVVQRLDGAVEVPASSHDGVCTDHREIVGERQ